MVPAEQHQVTRWCGTCNSNITGTGEGRVLAPAIFLPSCHWHYSHLDQVSQTDNTDIIIVIYSSVTRCESVKESLSIAKGTGLYVASSVIAQLDFFFIKPLQVEVQAQESWSLWEFKSGKFLSSSLIFFYSSYCLRFLPSTCVVVSYIFEINYTFFLMKFSWKKSQLVSL